MDLVLVLTLSWLVQPQLKGYSIVLDGLNVYVLYTEDIGGNNTLKP